MKLVASITDDKPRTQFPVQTSRLRDSVDGDARIIVARDSADAVRAVNGAIATADDLSRRSNPDATPAPRATDMIAVYDIDSRAFHSILLYRLDLRPRRAATVRKVVVFSDPPTPPIGRRNSNSPPPVTIAIGQIFSPVSATRTTARSRRTARGGQPLSWAGP